jgi:hypothetical protein
LTELLELRLEEEMPNHGDTEGQGQELLEHANWRLDELCGWPFVARSQYA